MNSLQSAGDGSVDLSRGPSLSGDPPGLRLGLEDGVRGSLYRDLRKEDDRNISSCTTILFSSRMQESKFIFKIFAFFPPMPQKAI